METRCTVYLDDGNRLVMTPRGVKEQKENMPEGIVPAWIDDDPIGAIYGPRDDSGAVCCFVVKSIGAAWRFHPESMETLDTEGFPVSFTEVFHYFPDVGAYLPPEDLEAILADASQPDEMAIGLCSHFALRERSMERNRLYRSLTELRPAVLGKLPPHLLNEVLETLPGAVARVVRTTFFGPDAVGPIDDEIVSMYELVVRDPVGYLKEATLPRIVSVLSGSRHLPAVAWCIRKRIAEAARVDPVVCAKLVDLQRKIREYKTVRGR